MATPILNWNEIGILAKQIPSPTKVGKVYVPARSHFKSGFQKNEWVIELLGAKDSQALVFSVRPGLPYFYLTKKLPKKVSTPGAQSVFGITLAKQLSGATLSEIVQPTRERFLILRFKKEKGVINLVLNLIPAATEAGLFDGDELIERTKVKSETSFEIPQGSLDRAEMAVKVEAVHEMREFCELIESTLKQESESNESNVLQQKLKTYLNQQSKLLASQKKTLEKLEKEPNFYELGAKLKSILSFSPQVVKSNVIAYDPIEEKEISIPIDPKRSLSENVSHYFHLARRNEKKIEDAREQISSLEEKISEATVLLESQNLEEIKALLGLGGESQKPQHKIAHKWPGKQFQSKDGTTICVGKSKQENLDLTFKVARGNDLWMHVKAKPSAHVVILLNAGKTASLETLLDAAQVLLHFSGGNSWGKTEIDYTYRKYVKRIKGSDQVSYTQNKTLLVAPDRARLDKILNSTRNV